MEQSKIRSWWGRRQSLDGALTGKLAPEVLQRITHFVMWRRAHSNQS